MAQVRVKNPTASKATGQKYFKNVKKGSLDPIMLKIKELLEELKRSKDEFELSDSVYLKDNVALTLQKKIEQLRNEMNLEASKNIDIEISKTQIEDLENKSRQKFLKSVNSVVGVDFPAALLNEGIADFVKLQANKNAQLIKSAKEDFLKTVETIVVDGVQNGMRHEEMAKQILGKTGASKKLVNRTKLIARDQTLTLLSQINKKRATTLGVTDFIWQTVEDGRVRHEHKELNGKTFSYATGAKTSKGNIFPGQEINCRCIAINIFEV